MREIDERLLDQILETLRLLGKQVSDLYQRHGASSQDVIRCQERINQLRREVDQLRKGQNELTEGDGERRVDRAVSKLKWGLVGAVLLALVGALATGAVTMLTDRASREPIHEDR